MGTFLNEVKEEYEPPMCKLGQFIRNQDLTQLEKEGRDPITDENLAEAKAKYQEKAVLAALRKRGLHCSDNLLRSHLTKNCACQTAGAE